MAKKTPWETQKPAADKGSRAKQKEAVVKAPEKAPAVLTDAAETAQKPVAPPIAETIKIIKKKARYVRERKKREPDTKDAQVTPRSKTTAEKIMSKNVPVAPKEDSQQGPKFGPKRKP